MLTLSPFWLTAIFIAIVIVAAMVISYPLVFTLLLFSGIITYIWIENPLQSLFATLQADHDIALYANIVITIVLIILWLLRINKVRRRYIEGGDSGMSFLAYDNWSDNGSSDFGGDGGGGE